MFGTTLLFFLLPLLLFAKGDSITIIVNASHSLGPLTPIHRFFGCDEPNYAYLPRGRSLLHELGSLGPAQTYFRTHNLLTTGQNGTIGVPGLKFGSTNAYTLSPSGSPIYNFSIVDAVFDSYLEAGVKPYVEIGFMPLALAKDPEPYFFNFTPAVDPSVIYTGWSHVPVDYQGWEELVYEWAKHCLDRYGEVEVESWWWEVWNEPNIAYWNGTREEFFMLHDHAVNGVRRALPNANVGGCEVAGGAASDYLGAFLNHSLFETNFATGRPGTPLDFISFHSKGAPTFVNTSGSDGFIRMNVSTQLRQIDQAFGVVASYPQLIQTPIVMGEYDPDGCAACITPQYGYRNGLLYPAYTAAAFVRALDLSDRHHVNLQGALTWAFEYEQTALLNEMAYFDGFRVLTTQGIDKPVLNVHRMFGKMGGQRVQANSTGQVPLDVVLANGILNQTDVGVLASTDENKVYTFIWHYHDDNLDFPDADIELNLNGLPFSGAINVTHYRIDNDRSNSYAAWLAMGSPPSPTQQQYDELSAAGKLAMLEPAKVINVQDNRLLTSFSLPIRALSLLVVEKTGGCGTGSV